MLYAHVENGSVDYMGVLPKSWKNATGLHLSEGNDEFLKTLNWFPLVETNATPTANQTFNKDVVTIEEDKVLLIHSVRDMTEEEVASRDASNLQHLREVRDQKLVASDWTQAPDYPTPLADAKKDEWNTYRQALRDLPTTVGPVWPCVWPTEPA